MACAISCMISTMFLIGMIYFYNMTEKSEIVNHYKQSLSSDLQQRYDTIRKERLTISYQGYALGFLFSLLLIYFHMRQEKKWNNMTLVCIIMLTMFVTNYFYYTLHPKTDWMLYHLQNKQELRAWLAMYREMQFQYHIGMVLGIIAVGIFAYAFRC